MKKLLLLISVATIAMHAKAQHKPSVQSIVEETCKQAALQHKNAFITFMHRGVAGVASLIIT